MSEDFIDGIDQAPSHSASPAVVSSSIEDEVIDLDFLDTVDDKDIAKDQYRKIEPGRHTLIVLDVRWAGGKSGDDETIQRRPRNNKVYIIQPDGNVIPATYDSRQVMIIYAKHDDLKCQVTEYLQLPPSTPKERHAYETGYRFESDAEKVAAGESDRQGGEEARKLKFVLARLGFFPGEDKKLPAAANRLANWIYYEGTNVHRFISLEVTKTFNKERNTWYTNVGRYSHQYVDPKEIGVNLSGGDAGATTDPAPAPEKAAAPSKKRK